MPYLEEMTWEKRKHRWRRMEKGKLWVVSCRQLALPPDAWTREGSRTAANEWWRNKLAELNGNPVAERLEEIAAVPVAEMKRVIELASVYRAVLKAGPDAPTVEDVLAMTPDAGPVDRLPLLDKITAKITGNTPAVPSDRTIGGLVARWLEEKRCELRPKPYQNLCYLTKEWDHLEHQRQVVLRDGLDGGTINEDTVRLFSLWCRGLDLSRSQKRQRVLYFRAFVRWLYKMRILENLPRNLDSLKIDLVKTKVELIDVAEVRDMLATLKPFHKMYAFLVLNTGMNNCDIGLLTKGMVKNGILTRKRVKTSEQVNVPEVSYRLWPETLELLQQFKSSHPTLWLLSKDGTQLYQTWYTDDGKAHAKDLIGQQWGRGEYPFTLEELRRLPAQVFRTHKNYQNFVEFFLGQAPDNVAKVFYAPESQKLFFKALDWLRTEILAK